MLACPEDMGWGFPASADDAQAPHGALAAPASWGSLSPGNNPLTRRFVLQILPIHPPNPSREVFRVIRAAPHSSGPLFPQHQLISVLPSHLADLWQQEPAARGGDPAAGHHHHPPLLLPLLRPPHQRRAADAAHAAGCRGLQVGWSPHPSPVWRG